MSGELSFSLAGFIICATVAIVCHEIWKLGRGLRLSMDAHEKRLRQLEDLVIWRKEGI